MVYERLPRGISHVKVTTPAHDPVSELQERDNTSGLTLLIPWTSTSILATCKRINAEASPLVQGTVRTHILEKPPRVTGSNDEFTLKHLERIFSMVVQQFLAAKDNGRFMSSLSLCQSGDVNDQPGAKNIASIYAFVVTAGQQLYHRYSSLARSEVDSEPATLNIEYLYTYIDHFPGPNSAELIRWYVRDWLKDGFNPDTTEPGDFPQGAEQIGLALAGKQRLLHKTESFEAYVADMRRYGVASVRVPRTNYADMEQPAFTGFGANLNEPGVKTIILPMMSAERFEEWEDPGCEEYETVIAKNYSLENFKILLMAVITFELVPEAVLRVEHIEHAGHLLHFSIAVITVVLCDSIAVM